MILDPGQYGCSSKLPFCETFELASMNNGSSKGDYSVTLPDGPYAHSIDRVFRCSDDWPTFADIALNHAFGDVLVAGATPHHVMFSFEFGPDTDENERARATKAFFEAASARSVHVGKCHSSIAQNPTSVTIAVCGNGLRAITAPPSNGLVCLSRPLGASKMHFLAEMGLSADPTATDILRNGNPAGFCTSFRWAALSDVSGDGLAGAVLSMGARFGADILLTLNLASAFAPDVLEVEVDCLVNPSSSYANLPITAQCPRAWHLMRLRETAGPFVGLLNAGDANLEELERRGALVLGTFCKGTGKVQVEWQS